MRNKIVNDSSIGIAIGLTSGVRFPTGKDIFPLHSRTDRLWGPLNTYLMGTGGCLRGGKATGA
jgi:hypothetical protein